MPAPKDPAKREEWLANMRKARVGRRLTAEHRANIGAALSRAKAGVPRPDMRGDGNPMRRPDVAAKLRGDGNGRWSGTLSYDAAHSRLESDRGVAKIHPCRAACGRPARDWALLRGRGKFVGGSHDNAFSDDPSDYVPLCRSCHGRYDKGTLNLPAHQ